MPLLNKILVCEDQDDVAHLLNMALGDAGYLCLRARDGEQALFLVGAEQPDLLILDVMMPRMDGITVCRKLKGDPLLSRVPILMLTALAEVSDKVKGLESGADDYLPKPFDLRELHARVRALIRASRRERDRSPVTGLPGPATFENAVGSRLAAGKPFVVMHADVAGYDAFVEAQGFRQAEQLVAGLGRALAGAAQGHVLTHLGGDDFALVVDADLADDVAGAVKDAAGDALQSYQPKVRLVLSRVDSGSAVDVDGLAKALAAARKRAL